MAYTNEETSFLVTIHSECQEGHKPLTAHQLQALVFEAVNSSLPSDGAGVHYGRPDVRMIEPAENS